MTIYNVHIYREMRVVFGGIDAASHEESVAEAQATSARHRSPRSQRHRD